MTAGQPTFTSQTLKTPRAAAIAGIVFMALFSTSTVDRVRGPLSRLR